MDTLQKYGTEALVNANKANVFLQLLTTVYAPGLVRPAVLPYDKNDRYSGLYDEDGTEMKMDPAGITNVTSGMKYATYLRLHPELGEYFEQPSGLAPMYMAFISRGHATVVFLHRNKLYSLGFGSAGDIQSGIESSGLLLSRLNLGQAVMMSPDALVKAKGKTSSGELHKARLVDAGILRGHHLKRLQNYLNSIKLGVDSTGTGYYNGDENTFFDYEERDGHRFGYYNYILNATYSLISFPDIVKTTGTLYNCTSALEDIFRETLTCPFNDYLGISFPEKCTTRRLYRLGGINGEAFIHFVLQYLNKMNNNQNIVDENAETILFGGVKSRTKRHRSPKRKSHKSPKRSRRRRSV